MLVQTHTLAGAACQINVPETSADLAGFDAFLARGDKVLGLDTETTHLDIYAPSHACRLVQIGNRDEAWVLRPDRFAPAIREALAQPRHFTAHNAPFDLLTLDRHGLAPLEDLGPRTFDTRVFAHLLDPRPEHEGGAGLALKPLSTLYVDPAAEDGSKALRDVFRREYKATLAEGWARIDVDHPVYTLYAGLDPILAVRLFDELGPMVKAAGLADLATFEHHLALILARMQRRGVLVDVDYTEGLISELHDEAAAQAARAATYGVANVNSTSQVAEALSAMGETLTERTPSGSPKVDKGVLLPLADLGMGWERIGAREPNPLADAVLRSKRAAKWSTAYGQAFLDLRDPADRLHPSLGALQARTARMSISRPPLQQLPSGDWQIRRALIADPGHLMLSADYDQIELRVLAGLADVKGMKRAIAEGSDLHDFTARLVYGEGFTKAHRKLMKGVGFGKVYGGGAATLARQTGAPLAQVKTAVAEYDSVYPEVKRYARRLQRSAQFGKREVVTPTGRHLPLDRDRLYSATNYMCQSTARDVLAQALVNLDAAGLGEHLLMPIHDEVLAQAPAEDAEDVARTLGEVMSTTLYGVPITAGGEVGGRSWGSAYGCPPERDAA